MLILQDDTEICCFYAHNCCLCAGVYFLRYAQGDHRCVARLQMNGDCGFAGEKRQQLLQGPASLLGSRSVARMGSVAPNAAALYLHVGCTCHLLTTTGLQGNDLCNASDVCAGAVLPPIYVQGPAGVSLKDNIHIQLRCTKHWLRDMCMEVHLPCSLTTALLSLLGLVLASLPFQVLKATKPFDVSVNCTG